MTPQLDIIDATLAACPVTRGKLYGEDRSTHAVTARWVAMRLMRDEGYTLTAIGRIFGRGHDTVMHGLRQLSPTDHHLKKAREILAGRQPLTVRTPSTTLTRNLPRPCAGDVW